MQENNIEPEAFGQPQSSGPNKDLSKSDGGLYTSECLKALARSNVSGNDFLVEIHGKNVDEPLPPEFSSLKILCKAGNRRCFGTEYANFFTDLLKKHNPYCCWSFKYNHVRKEGSKKRSAPFFQSKAVCSMKSCPHVVYLKVQHQDSKVVNISFKGNINQESCIYAVRRLTDGKKEYKNSL